VDTNAASVTAPPDVGAHMLPACGEVVAVSERTFEEGVTEGDKSEADEGSESDDDVQQGVGGTETEETHAGESAFE
jgi:hypothetical protein